MFVTLEGIEGCGKTTQVGKLNAHLRASGRACLATREPGGTLLGGRIRALLLDPASAGLHASAELMLYMADRIQHVREVIEPALSGGLTVICDRFFDATIAYQGYGRGLDIRRIEALHRMLLEGICPDVTLLLDLPVEIGLSRAWRRIETEAPEAADSRFEREALDFHRRVRAGYLELAGREPSRFRIIDAAGDPEQVHKAILEALAL